MGSLPGQLGVRAAAMVIAIITFMAYRILSIEFGCDYIPETRTLTSIATGGWLPRCEKYIEVREFNRWWELGPSLLNVPIP